MNLVIYNTESRKKEVFEPIKKGQVSMYVCGPTVYDFLHVGNFRGPIFFNLVRNWLEHLGYKVTYVLNYTDIDDKIIDRAKKDNRSAQEVSETYIQEYKKDFNLLGLRPHDHNPKVTDFIPQIVSIIQKIIDNGLAYIVDGEVIFSVKKFKEYGKLSHKNIEDLIAGIRVEISEKKKDPLDFTLWKPAKPDEPKWPSPWSEGRPGWHIECSAMASSLLGEQIDIHGGGIDLIFPHHENEIAQSEGATHKHFVKYWMHHNFLNFGAHKMSKSLGNVKTARSFLEQYGGEVMKFMYSRTHYRSLVDFSESQIEDAIQGLARIYSALNLANMILLSNGGEAPVYFVEALKKANEQIEDSLNDDFNTPKVFAQIFDVIRAFNSHYKRGQKITPATVGLALEFKKWIVEKGKLMSLFQEPPQEYLIRMDNLILQKKQINRADIDQIVQERTMARSNKDFKKSDELRDKLISMGIQLQDTPQGTFWEVQK